MLPALGTLALLVLGWIGAPTAHALDMGDIVVTNIQGEVKFTLNGAPRSLKNGAVLTLPAIVRTGKDGSVELKQGFTSVRVGPETELNFPATETRGGPIDRIVQPRGNAFYDVGKRSGRKLRVETPVLVGVVKGTQFNVAALEDGTTISLFEGRLEVLDADGVAVDLNAGEIAARKRDDTSTRILKMDSKTPSGAAPRTSSSVGAAGSELPAESGRDAGADAGENLSSSLLASDLALAGSAGAPSVVADPGTNIPEVPVDPVQPDAGSGAPDDGIIPPDVGTPDSGAIPPDVGAPDGGAIPPDVGAPDGGVSPPDLGAGGDIVTPPDSGAGLPVDDTVTPPDVVPDLGTGPDTGEVPDLDIDDGNNGHGNDDDRDDSSNPGRSKDRGRDK